MLPPDGHVHTEWSWDAAAGAFLRPGGSAAGTFDRVLGSVHSLELGGLRLVDFVSDRAEPADLIRAYLDEALRMVESAAPFAVLAAATK